MEELKWEFFLKDVSTMRLKVPTGWIIIHQTDVENDDGYMIPTTESMCFVPDPEHLWN